MNEIEMLACGYGLVEGPRVDGDDNLYFSDVHNGGVHRRRPDGTIETVVPKRRGVGGIALHTDGGLVISGRNICHVRDGETRVVFAPDAPGLNDLFVDGAGRVICGTIRSDPFSIDGPRTAGECWLIDTDGIVTELYGDVALTNGIGLSPDGTVLYHSDTTRGIWAHDYDDGKVTDRRLFVQRDDLSPDGLAVDEAGHRVGGGRVRLGRCTWLRARRFRGLPGRSAGADGHELVLRRDRPPRPLHRHGRQHLRPRARRHHLQDPCRGARMSRRHRDRVKCPETPVRGQSALLCVGSHGG